MSLDIGVDPGTKTGLAAWDRANKCFVAVETLSIVAAMEKVLCWHRQAPVRLRFEDARQRTWFAEKGREALQGAGSIKRDCSIWEEFCTHHRIPFMMVPPQRGATKWSAEHFRKMSGWQGRTSEHARDAGSLVVGL